MDGLYKSDTYTCKHVQNKRLQKYNQIQNQRTTLNVGTITQRNDEVNSKYTLYIDLTSCSPCLKERVNQMSNKSFTSMTDKIMK